MADSKKFLYLPLALAAALLWLQFSIRPPQLKTGLDFYWAAYWASHYGPDFCRRSLLGTLLSPLGEIASQYDFIAVLAWAAMLVFWFRLTVPVIRFLRPLNLLFQCLFVTAILLSPAWTALLIEIVGDPLQVVFAVFLLLLADFIRRDLFPTWYGLLWFAFGVAASLVHEASAFFMLPCLATAVWLDRGSGKRKALMACLAGLLVGVLSIVAFGKHSCFESGGIAIRKGQGLPKWTTVRGRERYLGLFPAPADTTLTFEEVNPSTVRTFQELLGNQQRYFFSQGFPHGLYLIVWRLCAVMIVPLAQSWVVCSLLEWFKSQPAKTTAGVLVNWLRFYGLPLVCTFPLWMIGSDWGRFAGYSLMLQTVVLCLQCPKQNSNDGGSKVKALPGWLICQGVLLSAFSAYCTVPELTTYRIWGLNQVWPLLRAGAGFIVVFFGVSVAQHFMRRGATES